MKKCVKEIMKMIIIILLGAATYVKRQAQYLLQVEMAYGM